MHKIIRRSIEVFFGQINNVLGRQQDFTISNLSNLLKTLRKGFAETCKYNKLQPKNSRMTTNELAIEFVRELMNGFVIFLSNTKFGNWVLGYTWKKLIFTKIRLIKIATLGVAYYIVWRYWTKQNKTISVERFP